METMNTMPQGDARARSETMEQSAGVAPAVDVYEGATEILLVVDLPGVSREGVAIQCEKDRLSLRAKRAGQERDYVRTFVLPRGIDVERIGAHVEAGVLTVRLPRSRALEPRQIPVEAR